jgi:hypothetical protein
MKMSEHTPGPWNIHRSTIDNQPFVVNPGNGDVPWVAFSQDIAVDEKVIAEVTMQTAKGGWPRVDNVEEAKANARLICAAPELLEALKAMVSANGGVAVMPTQEAKEQNAALAQARSAIAKAEGKQ